MRWIAVILIVLPGAVQAQVIPTYEWVTFWSDSTYVEGSVAPVGAIIQAYDPQGVLCGEFTIFVAGSYGLMSVYGDDPSTPGIDEGAEPGDTISFTIDGSIALPKGPDTPVWSFNGDVKKLNLSVEDVPTFLQRSSLRYTGESIDVRWELSHEIPGVLCTLWRKITGLSGYAELSSRDIDQTGARYYYNDTNIKPRGEYSYMVRIQEVSGTTSLMLGSTRVPSGKYAFNISGPNPFRDRIRFRFSVPEPSLVSLCVYNTQGRLIRRLADREWYEAGFHDKSWDGWSASGRRVSKGVYFVKFTSGKYQASKKVALIE